ncbi:MAG: histidine kinase, partial [Bacteroidota bacterium]
MKMNRFHKTFTLVTIIITVCDKISLSQSISSLKKDFEGAITAQAKADVCFNISRKYASSLKIDSAIYFANQVKEFSEKDNYKTGMGKYHLALSTAYNYRALKDKSVSNASEAVRIFTDQKEYSLVGQSWFEIGRAEEGENNSDLSRKYFRTSAQFLLQSNDSANLFKTYYWMGRSYDFTSDYDSAASYYIKTLELAEIAKDPYKIFSAAIELGEEFLNMGEITKAYQYLHYGLKYRTSTANKVGIWLNIADYAICLSLLHDFARADSAISEFEIITKQFDQPWGWVILDKLKGIQEFERQNFKQALKYLSSAYNKRDQIIDNKLDLKDIALNLGRTEYKMQLYDSAIIHLEDAVYLSHSVKQYLREMEADLLLSESFSSLSRLDSALFYFRQYSAIKESVLSLEKQKVIADVSARYETEKKEQEIKILQKEKEANSYLLQIRNQQIEKQQLENDKKTQQLDIALKQNEINKLDVSQKALNLDNQRKENEKQQAKLKLIEKDAAYQKLLASKENQQKNIAWVSIVVILTLGSYIIYRYIRRRKLQNQQEVLNERLRISRELHDEVGSTLSGIAMYSHLTKQQIKASKTEEVERSLSNIHQSASDMIAKLSDIVWLINPEKDSFQKLIERLEEFATNIAQLKNIELKLNFDNKLMETNLPFDKRRTIYLFCKEAINNAIKY